MESRTTPPEVSDLLGPSPLRLLGYGASTVLSGRGLVAKVGPAHVVAREARILGERVGPMPVAHPALVASGAGWLVMDEVPDIALQWDEVEFTRLLGDLARLHDAYEGSPALGGGWLRDPAGKDLEATLAEGGDRSGVVLPEALARVPDDPRSVATILAGARPLTLVHGDPTPNNVRRPGGSEDLVWIDWEWASAASPAVDLACWLGEGPWKFGRRLDRDRCLAAYLGARRHQVDRPELERALDAALVLLFFASNLPSLVRCSGKEALDALIAERLEALERLGLA